MKPIITVCFFVFAFFSCAACVKPEATTAASNVKTAQAETDKANAALKQAAENAVDAYKERMRKSLCNK